MLKAIVNDTEIFKIENSGSAYLLNELPFEWDLVKIDKNTYHAIYKHKSYTIDVLAFDLASKSFHLKINNKACHVQIKDRYDNLLHDLGMDAIKSEKAPDIKAPMPGMVVDVRVISGQQLKKGDPVIVLEAMKMENILKASADAIVKNISVKKGSKVEKNEVLVTLQ